MESKNVTIKKTAENTKLLVFFGMAILTILIGFYYMPDVQELLAGWGRIIRHHALANSDYFAMAGDYGAEFMKTVNASDKFIYITAQTKGVNFGSTFINSGILQLCVLATYKLTKTEIKGTEIAALFMVAGYSFYSKSIFNVWPLVIGVFLEAKVHGRAFNKVAATAWFSTAIAPMTSVLAFGTPVLGVGTTTSIITGIAFALVAGYICGLIAGYAKRLHQGYILFNMGFVAGIAGTFMFAIMSATGLGHGSYKNAIYLHNYNLQLGLTLAIFWAYLIICGFVINKGSENVGNLVFHKFKSGDFVSIHGFGTTLVNMGVMGAFGTIACMLKPIQNLNGAAISGIFTVAGFGASGMTVLSVLPIIIGITCGQFLTGSIPVLVKGGAMDAAIQGGMKYISEVNSLVALMFGLGLSPVTVSFGVPTAFIIGMVHSIIVLKTGALHGWMDTYNNGFAMGVSITFYLALFRRISHDFKYDMKDEIPENEW